MNQQIYKNTGAIHTDNENDHYLEEITKSKNESSRRILISELNDCRSMPKRKEILDKIFELDKKIDK